jgi:two-component system chemotaxis sensor kinase CheA
VQIRVSDDGAGLDRDAIRARAIERGFIRPDAVLTEQQIDALILAPGFSTASSISEISGRGVGMDVVQRNLDAMRGSLSISSTPGKGSVITLKIPLTLAIIDGLLVEAGDSRFVVPLSNVSGCMELARGDRSSSRESLVSVRGELVPCISLRARFGIPGDPPANEEVIIAETHDGLYGFVVDRVVGDHHTVIKKLGRLFRDIDEVSGATILGDGSLALILDVERLAASAVRERA